MKRMGNEQLDSASHFEAPGSMLLGDAADRGDEALRELARRDDRVARGLDRAALRHAILDGAAVGGGPRAGGAPCGERGDVDPAAESRQVGHAERPPRRGRSDDG